MAGRAAPGAEVILRANGREIGRVRADAQGQWVFAGGPRLPFGDQEITLAVLVPGGREIAGANAILVVVAARPSAPEPTQAAGGATVAAATTALPPSAAIAPAAPAAATAPIVLMTSAQAAPRLLQAPGRTGGPARLGLDLVDYDNAGEIRFAGAAPPGSTVRIYVNDAFVADATPDAAGRWSAIPGAQVPQGDHRLRLDQMDPHGRVLARVEMPFQRARVEAGTGAADRVVVQPRQSLWRIARRAYGRGVRYTEIFEANRDQIADPDQSIPVRSSPFPPTPPPPRSRPAVRDRVRAPAGTSSRR